MPVWLGVVVGVLSAAATIIALGASVRGWVDRLIEAKLKVDEGPILKLIEMEHRWHRIEQHVFNGLTTQVDTTADKVNEIQVTVARIDANLESLSAQNR